MNQTVLILIVANVLVSLKGFNDVTFFDRYKFQVGKIQAGEKWRLMTSGFLHADMMHLGFNMYALYLFGGLIATRFAMPNILFIYFGSLLVGSLYSLFQNKRNVYYSAIGASGAVAGVMISAVMLFPNKSYGFLFFPFFEFPAYALGIGYLLYSIYGMKNQLGNVGHSAHLGGAIGGYALTLLLKPNVFSNNSLMIGIMGAIILGLLLFGNKIKIGKS